MVMSSMAGFVVNLNRVVPVLKLKPAIALICRRGYAVGTHSGPAMEEKKVKVNGPPVIRDESGALSSWVPDPITGFYKPEHHVKDHLDPAQLRAAMPRHKRNQP